MSNASMILFVVLVGATLGITYWAGKKNTSASDHYVAGGHISGTQNGIAIAGDFLSAATFLGTTGAIALTGFNGFYLALYIPIAYVVALLLVAEPLRNLGQFTMADVLSVRFPQTSLRTAMAFSTIAINLLYMCAQFVAAGALVVLLFDIDYKLAVLIIGALTMVYTLYGGMLATTWIQIIKTFLLVGAGILMLMLVWIKLGGSPLTAFTEAIQAGHQAPKVPTGEAIVQPARGTMVARLDQFSSTLGLTLGVMGLPHVMIRFLTVANSKAARASAVTSIWIFCGFLAMLPVIAYGAYVLVTPAQIIKDSPGGNLALPALAENLGGDLLVSFVSAVAFATILAVLSGLTISTSGAIAHDLYSKVMKKGQVDPDTQMRVARIATFGTGVAAVLIALAAEGQNVAFLASLAIAIAASANLPALLFTIYGKTTTAAGVTAGLFAGLISAIVIIALGPTFHQNNPDAALIPFKNPAIFSLPIGFIVMWVVSLATAPKGAAKAEHDALFDDVRYRAVTGQSRSRSGAAI